jgi:carbonic anhydrase
MSIIDQAVKANEQFAKRYDPKLGGHPQPKIAIVTCMDPRLSDLEGILGLKTADMDVIRTGGPALTDDVMGELVVSTRNYGDTTSNTEMDMRGARRDGQRKVNEGVSP